jgi:hypothetical protein
MLLAGLVLGAKERPTRGYIYIRHEYTEQIGACRVAIERARRLVPEALELCPLEVFVSPGLYICGEESALIEAIEGKRAQPRNQPPDIRNNGLWDEPTLVNNVETFAWVPSILMREPHDWYKKEPLRFFSISGDVKNPGVFEVSFRTTLGQIIEMAGGMRDGLQFYAVAPSGPSGGHLPATLDGELMRKTLDAGIPGLTRRSKLQGERVAEYRKKFTGDRISVLDLPLDVPLYRTLELSRVRRPARAEAADARSRAELPGVLQGKFVRQVRPLPAGNPAARPFRRASEVGPLAADGGDV